jgi:Ca2+-transporting ATPase
LQDPCRPGVKSAVQLCTNAGVKVRMVTGDNIETAKAIALECGILDANGAFVEPFVIEGKVFREMSEAARGDIVDKITVTLSSSMFLLSRCIYIRHYLVVIYIAVKLNHSCD